MSQAFLLHRAKQGDSQAIAKLLAQSLLFRKIEIIDASLEEDCLQLKIKARKVVSQHKVMPFIQEELISLDLEIINKLEVYAFVGEGEEAAWKVTVDLTEKAHNLTDTSNIIAAKTDELEGEEVSLELRAKRGDSNAVLELLNQDLEPRNLNTQLRFHKGYLQVLIEPESRIDREDAVQLIRQKILDTKLPLIKKVTVYGKDTEDPLPVWHQDFDNSSNAPKVEASVTPSHATKVEEPVTPLTPHKIESSVAEEEPPKGETHHPEKKESEPPVKESKNGFPLPLLIAISLGIGILIGGVGGYVIFKPQAEPTSSETLQENVKKFSQRTPEKIENINQLKPDPTVD